MKEECDVGWLIGGEEEQGADHAMSTNMYCKERKGRIEEPVVALYLPVVRWKVFWAGEVPASHAGVLLPHRLSKIDTASCRALFCSTVRYHHQLSETLDHSIKSVRPVCELLSDNATGSWIQGPRT